MSNKIIYQKILLIILILGVFLCQGARRLSGSPVACPPSSAEPPPMLFRVTNRALIECGLEHTPEPDPQDRQTPGRPINPRVYGPFVAIERKDGLRVIYTQKHDDGSESHHVIGTIWGDLTSSVPQVHEFIRGCLDVSSPVDAPMVTLLCVLGGPSSATLFYDETTEQTWDPKTTCVLISALPEGPGLPPIWEIERACCLPPDVV
ncbi:MAG: hypothetical protein NkDv07_0298 [Candidatus Improbicoccus devescovinae]|nr:MAG: hypothetical protein NkDv07_0298 [Candidatus Improbicoccus devescovinae]